MKSIFGIFIFTLLLSYTGTSFAAATATVNRDTVSADETLTLVISSDSPKDVDRLNLQPLEVDFDVLNTSESSQFSIVNGNTSANKVWQITLAPKRSGRLTIPGLDVGRDRTNSIGISVSKSVPMSERAGNENIFMEAELNLDTAWVQQEIIYTTRLFYHPGLNRGADLAELAVPNTIVTQISETNYKRNVKGKNYSVYEIKYALFPQSSGTLTIPGQVFTGSLSDARRSNSFFGYGNSGTAVRLKNVDLEIGIEPRPAGFVGKQWLPARKITLREQWSENPNGMQVGQPLTRSVIIEADGLQASQLPPLDIASPIGAQLYPDEPVNNEVVDSKGVRSTRTENMALIPSVDGNLTLPEVSLNWWNTATQTMETATLSARTFSVLPGSSATVQSALTESNESFDVNAASAATNKPSSSFENLPTAPNWKHFFFGALGLWLVTLGALFRHKTPHTTGPADAPAAPKIATEAETFAACRRLTNEPKALRQALIAWGKHHWSPQRVNSNTDIANLAKNTAIREQLYALDAAVYNGTENTDTAFDANSLLDELEKLRAAGTIKSTQHATKLEPLFQSDK